MNVNVANVCVCVLLIFLSLQFQKLKLYWLDKSNGILTVWLLFVWWKSVNVCVFLFGLMVLFFFFFIIISITIFHMFLFLLSSVLYTCPIASKSKRERIRWVFSISFFIFLCVISIWKMNAKVSFLSVCRHFIKHFFSVIKRRKENEFSFIDTAKKKNNNNKRFERLTFLITWKQEPKQIQMEQYGKLDSFFFLLQILHLFLKIKKHTNRKKIKTIYRGDFWKVAAAAMATAAAAIFSLYSLIILLFPLFKICLFYPRSLDGFTKSKLFFINSTINFNFTISMLPWTLLPFYDLILCEWIDSKRKEKTEYRFVTARAHI